MLWQFSRQWLKNCLHWFDFAKYFDIIWWIWYLRLDLVRCTFSLFGTFNHNFSRRVISQKMHNYYCRSSSQQPLQKFRQRDLPWFSLSCTFVWFENNDFRMQQNMYLSKGHICSFICYCIQYPSLVSSLLFLFHHHHYKCIWRPRRIFILSWREQNLQKESRFFHCTLRVCQIPTITKFIFKLWIWYLF